MFLNLLVIVIALLIFVQAFIKYCPHAPIMKSQLMAYFFNFLTNLMAHSSRHDYNKDDSTLLANGRAVKIYYTFAGRKYSILLPYRAGLTKLGQRLILTTKDGHEEDITQQSGIPYFITPQDLNGDVQLRDRRNRVLKEFNGNDLIGNYSGNS